MPRWEAMKKITLSFNALAAISAVTILQACAHTTGTQTGTQCVCETPTLTPPSATGPVTAVLLKTTTKEAYLRYTRDDSKPTGGPSGNGTTIVAQSGSIPGPLVFGRTLKAIAYKAGCDDSPVAVGHY